VNTNPYDDVITNQGTRHPLAGLRFEYLQVAREAVHDNREADLSDPEMREALADAVVCQLRAAGLLKARERFHHVSDGRSHWVRDEGDWPHHVDLTKTLFGRKSITPEQAEWAADRLNRGESVSARAWGEHCAQGMPDEFGPYLAKALKDPEFREAYERAQEEEGRG
jgi:hypothetical protein